MEAYMINLLEGGQYLVNGKQIIADSEHALAEVQNVTG